MSVLLTIKPQVHERLTGLHDLPSIARGPISPFSSPPPTDSPRQSLPPPPPPLPSRQDSQPMTAHHRGLPPPGELGLHGIQPNPTPPQPTQLPQPPGWHQEDNMRHWLSAKMEDDKRRQEEEKTKQENLKLETRLVERDILDRVLKSGVAPNMIPAVLASIGGSAAASISMAQYGALQGQYDPKQIQGPVDPSMAVVEHPTLGQKGRAAPPPNQLQSPAVGQGQQATFLTPFGPQSMSPGTRARAFQAGTLPAQSRQQNTAPGQQSFGASQSGGESISFVQWKPPSATPASNTSPSAKAPEQQQTSRQTPPHHQQQQQQQQQHPPPPPPPHPQSTTPQQRQSPPLGGGGDYSSSQSPKKRKATGPQSATLPPVPPSAYSAPSSGVATPRGHSRTTSNVSGADRTSAAVRRGESSGSLSLSVDEEDDRGGKRRYPNILDDSRR